MLKMLCEKFKDRSEELGLKGKKRDDAAINFFCGAANVLESVDESAAKQVKMFIVWSLATRGYEAIARELVALKVEGK